MAGSGTSLSNASDLLFANGGHLVSASGQTAGQSGQESSEEQGSSKVGAGDTFVQSGSWNGVQNKQRSKDEVQASTTWGGQVDGCLSPVGTPPARPTRESVLRRLSEALLRRSLTMIDMSQRGLLASDARLVRLALLQNASLSVLKLGYNNLGDEGVATLASGIAAHGSLSSLDLGFNNVGDYGCKVLADALMSCPSTRKSGTPTPVGGMLHTLYLAGNCLGEEGAVALANAIRRGCSLRRLHLTGNKVGPNGVKAITEAISFVENLREVASNSGGRQENTIEARVRDSGPGNQSPQQPQRTDNHKQPWGVEELFLGGTGMGPEGCLAVSRMLGNNTSLRVLSLANCNMGDEEIFSLAESIKRNQHLPLEALQLSFNDITSNGVESLIKAFSGTSTLRELRLDNNSIGDRGAQSVASTLSRVKTIEVIDLGFNSVSSSGMKILMKAVAENDHLSSLSISGNIVDVGAAKAVAYALAYNRSLKTIFLDHCLVNQEGQRHITAGIVSNCGTSLHTFTGFRLGASIASLGLPAALQSWTNEQILKFVNLMWEGMRLDMESSIERELDPLHFLPSSPGCTNSGIAGANAGPLDPATVVHVAKRAFASLGDNGNEILSRQQWRPREPSFESPLAEDAIMLEASEVEGNIVQDDQLLNTNIAEEDVAETSTMDVGESSDESTGEQVLSGSPQYVVTGPTSLSRPQYTDSARRRRIVNWLCQHMNYLNELSQLPFNSSELWRLHQHFFSQVINETVAKVRSQSSSPNPSIQHISHPNSARSEPFVVYPSTKTSAEQISIPVSDPTLVAPPPGTRCMGTLPMLKRKVSYRFLGDAVPASGRLDTRSNRKGASVSKMIEDGMTGLTMQPKSKRARRLRSRISYLPRIRAKLDSFLDVCHEKALILMRQLFYVERALLSGSIHPGESLEGTTYLSGQLAVDAEMILIDLM